MPPEIYLLKKKHAVILRPYICYIQPTGNVACLPLKSCQIDAANHGMPSPTTVAPTVSPSSSSTVAAAIHKQSPMMSAYSLWARDQRKRQPLQERTSPFGPPAPTQPRQLIGLKKKWFKLSNQTKNAWRRKARRQLNKQSEMKNGASLAATAAVAPPLAAMPTTTPAATEPPTTTLRSDQIILSECTAVNAAAHLLLLGESLFKMGEQLAQFDGQVSVSGTLSVLLDSFLCSMGPLMALTKEIPNIEENPHLDAAISSTLDNIAYILPGLHS